MSPIKRTRSRYSRKGSDFDVIRARTTPFFGPSDLNKYSRDANCISKRSPLARGGGKCRNLNREPRSVGIR